MADPRRAALLLLPALFLVAALARPAAPQSPAPAPRPHTLTVTVTDKNGNPVAGLKPEDFGVFEGKLRLPLVSFSGGDEPASIGILLDASGSVMSAPRGMQEVHDALSRLVATANPSNEYFVLAFNQKPQMLVEPTTDRAAVTGALGRIFESRRRGMTALYDAVYLAVDKVAYGRHPKRVLLLVSDGQDSVSQYTFREARRALIESDATLYAVNVPTGEAVLDYTGRAILEEMASVTGGRFFAPFTEKELKGVFETLANELRYQYRLGFVPAPVKRKDGWHELKIKVADLIGPKNKKVGLVARSRPGFYEAAGRR